MTKTTCPSCGKKFITSAHAKSHADIAHPEVPEYLLGEPKRKGWATPYGFGDFTDPITYDEACMMMKEMTNKMFGRPQEEVTK